MDNKTCCSCNIEKPLDQFNKSKGGLTGACKTCLAERARQQYLKNREKRLAQAKANYQENAEAKKAYNKEYEKKAREADLEGFRAKKTAAQRARREAQPEEVKEYNRQKMRKYRKDPDKAMKSWLKHGYDLTVEQFRAMEAAQGNRCKICGTTPEQAGISRLFVDHCHATGKVRGLLCNLCNSMLGKAKDQVEILQKAIAYLTPTLSSGTTSPSAAPEANCESTS